MKCLFALILTFFFLSCNTQQEKSAEQFTQIINKIPVVKLPIKLGSFSNTAPITDGATLAWREQFFDTHLRSIWGRVFTDQVNVHLLATQADDQGTMFLVTFDKFGKLLSESSSARILCFCRPWVNDKQLRYTLSRYENCRNR